MTTGKKGQTVETQRQGEAEALNWDANDIMASMTSLQKKAYEGVTLNGQCGTPSPAEWFPPEIYEAVAEELRGLLNYPDKAPAKDKNKQARIAAAEAMKLTAGGALLTEETIREITKSILKGHTLHIGSPALARLRAIQYVFATKVYVEYRLKGFNPEKAWNKTQSSVRHRIAGKKEVSKRKSKSSDHGGGCPPEWELQAESWLTGMQRIQADATARSQPVFVKDTTTATPAELKKLDDFQLAPVHCAALLSHSRKSKKTHKFDPKYIKSEWGIAVLETPAGSNVEKVRGIKKRVSKHDSLVTLADFKDFGGFVAKFQTSSDSVSRFLVQNLKAETEADIPLVLQKNSSSAALLSEINHCIRFTTFPQIPQHKSKGSTTEQNIKTFWKTYEDYVDFGGESTKDSPKFNTIQVWIGSYDWRGILPESFAYFAEKEAEPTGKGLTPGIRQAFRDILCEHNVIIPTPTDAPDENVGQNEQSPRRRVGVGRKALISYYLPFVAMQTAKSIKAFQIKSGVPFEQNKFLIDREDVFNEVLMEFGCVLAYDYDPFKTPIPAVDAKGNLIGNSLARWAHHPTLHVLTGMLEKLGVYSRYESSRKRLLNAAKKKLQGPKGEPASDDELLKELNWTQSQILKAEEIRSRTRVPATPETIGHIEDTSETPEETSNFEDDASLFKYLWNNAELNELDRQVLLLLGIDGLGETEIAVGMDYTPSYITQIKERAFDALGLVAQGRILNYTPAQIEDPAAIITKLTDQRPKSALFQLVAAKFDKSVKDDLSSDETAQADEESQKVIVAEAFNAVLPIATKIDAKKAKALGCSRLSCLTILNALIRIKKRKQPTLQWKKVNRSILDDAFGDLVIRYNHKDGNWNHNPIEAMRRIFGRLLTEKSSNIGRPKGSTKAAKAASKKP